MTSPVPNSKFPKHTVATSAIPATQPYLARSRIAKVAGIATLRFENGPKAQFERCLKRFKEIGNANDALPEKERLTAWRLVEKEHDHLLEKLCALFNKLKGQL